MMLFLRKIHSIVLIYSKYCKNLSVRSCYKCICCCSGMETFLKLEIVSGFIDTVWIFVIRQRGSAWQCYIGRWLSIGKHAFFHLSAWKNHRKFRNYFWHRWLRWWDLKTRHIGLRSVHSGEISRFCDFCSPFFRFLISPTGRNSRPIRTFNSSNDVFWFVHVPFGDLEPSNSFLGGLRPKKHQHFDPFSDFSDLQRKLLQH